MAVDAEIMSAFDAIDPTKLDYEQWFKVSAVMHDEGLSEAEWDAWNRRDVKRYTERTNGRKWASIRGDGRATRKTVFGLAYANGWQGEREGGKTTFARRDMATTKGSVTTMPPEDITPKLDDYGVPEQITMLPIDMEPAEMMQRQLACMFRVGEGVGIAGADQCFYNERQQKWQPLAGKNSKNEVWHHNAEVFLANHVNASAGAWVRVNPTTGSGNADVTRYASALIESDDIEPERQLELYRSLHLPIRCVVDSGNKSMHAICIIDAADEQEYRKRVEWLRTYCDVNGLPTDHSNINPSRYVRLAGAIRGENVQRLVCEAMGPQSWGEFRAKVAELAQGQDESDDAPNIEFLDLSSIVDEPIVPLDEVIVGLLPRERVGQVVARGGSGKTFMAYEAALCVASGREWLGFWCRRGRALFIDPELHVSDIHRRVQSIAQTMGITSSDVAGRFDVVSLRGTTATADVLDMAIRQRIAATGKPYDLIIIDSINAILTGDENSSVDVRAFIASLQRLTKDTGAACLVFHHAGKGGGRGAGELARGSSVFLDGPDECMELMPLRVDQGTAADELLKAHTQTKANGEPIYATAWRLTFPKHRTGAPIKPIDIIFRHPLHVVDNTGELATCKVAGSSADHGEDGGNQKGANYRKVWDQMDALLDGIVADIRSEGGKPTRAACLDVLNERREGMGLKRWSKATFRNNTLRGGSLSYRVNPATNELYRLSDDELASESETEGGAVLDSP